MQQINNDIDNENLQKIICFLNEIGIKTIYGTLERDTFLPGICIENGGIIIDKEKLKYPGDILHEAGHIAVVETNLRNTLCENDIALRSNRDAEEMMAIAWSFAVCKHLDIDAGFVFHDQGYQNGGSSIADNFNEGRYFGVPMLQWTGMALENINEQNIDLPIYPKMLKWLRD